MNLTALWVSLWVAVCHFLAFVLIRALEIEEAFPT